MRGIVIWIEAFGLEEGWGGCQATGHPHGERRHHAVKALPGNDHRHWVNHSHVTVNGHDGQEDDAAVEAHVEDEAHSFAPGLSKSPGVDVVGGPEWQAHSENDVGQGQVQQEGVGHGLQVFILH